MTVTLCHHQMAPDLCNLLSIFCRPDTKSPSLIYHPLGSGRARNPGVTTEVVGGISRQRKGEPCSISRYSAICTLDGNIMISLFNCNHTRNYSFNCLYLKVVARKPHKANSRITCRNWSVKHVISLNLSNWHMLGVNK